jgi:hypothetical protein
MIGSFLHKLFVFVNFFTTENIKKLVAYSLDFGGNLSNFIEKNSKTLHHISTWILVWGPFFKANVHFFSNSKNSSPFNAKPFLGCSQSMQH